jgi:prolyl oligopeptidase
MYKILSAGMLFMSLITANAQGAQEDPYQWLEDVSGKKALDYVEAQNQVTFKELKARPEYEPIRTRVLSILNDKARIPYVSKQGAYYYNFWRDAANPRGLWRRTTLEEYRKPEPKWELVLDLDALAKEEKENWVWAGSSCLPPAYEKCMLSLSRGGADATVTREFDLKTKQFVKEGFSLPEAKSSVTWRDANTLYVGTDYGAGSMTDSGYPRVIKRWARGTPLAAASTVFEGKQTDVAAFAWVDHTPGFFREGFGRSIAFYNSEYQLLKDGKQFKYDIPADAELGGFREWMTVQLRSDWKVAEKTYKAGSLIVTKHDAFIAGERNFALLFEPTARTSLQGVSFTRNAALLNVSDNVASRVFEATFTDGKWNQRELKLPGKGTASASAVDANESDEIWVNYTDFLTPDSLYLSQVGKDLPAAIKNRPAYWDPKTAQVQQLFAKSKDGTQIPYFVLSRKDLKLDGTNPTLLYGYGGFEVPQVPWYSGSIGSSWLAQGEKGGVFVVANIRGGGEFGPAWHQAALKSNRQKAFDDFAAVAQDLHARKITSPQHLAIQGGSNGGLLVAAVLVQRPELFKAVVCQVPLTDMQRYHKLLAGASWMAEYGDPDKPEDWTYLSKYSPYQNVQKSGKYPRVLFTTSTRDDRVHPGHARKMYARMKEQGHNVLYYENTEGGHAGAADNEQTAKLLALEWTFLLNELR